MCDLNWRRCEDYAVRLEDVGTAQVKLLEALKAMIRYYEGTACHHKYGWATASCESFWEDAHRPALEAATWFFISRALGEAERRLGGRWRPVYDRMGRWLFEWMARFYTDPDKPPDLARFLESLAAMGVTRAGRVLASICATDPNCPSTSWRTWRDFLSLTRWREWMV